MEKNERRFLELVDGAVIRTSEVWLDELFIIKENLCLMNYRPAQDEKKDFLYVKRGGFWSVFESEFSMNYQEIQAFLRDMVDKHLNWKVTAPLTQPLQQ